MNERIKELIEQAGLSTLLGNNWLYGEQLGEFAELVRQDEREACAKLCEAKLQQTPYGTVIAAAIRARGEK